MTEQFSNDPSTVVGVVLAAGTGSRFIGETPKLLAPLSDGRTVLRASVEAAAEAGFGRTAVVVGSLSVAEAKATLEGLDVEVIVNPDFVEGQATSLQTAIAWATKVGARTMVVGLGDSPGIGTAAWRVVGASRGPAVFASFGTVSAPPVKLEDTVWKHLPREGDAGARLLAQSHSDLVSEVPCPGDPTDIDTAGDLEKWNSQTNSA